MIVKDQYNTVMARKTMSRMKVWKVKSSNSSSCLMIRNPIGTIMRLYRRKLKNKPTKRESHLHL
jgi:hypothetical protein